MMRNRTLTEFVGLLALRLFVGCTLLAPVVFAKNVFIESTKKTVAFIFASDTKGLAPLGTGFFAGVKAEGSQPERNYIYFVTAKHVITDQAGKLKDNAFIRLNKVDGGSEFLHLDVGTGDKSLVFLHPDNDQVDLAVIPVSIDNKKFDVRFVPDDIVLTRNAMKQLEISEGADTFFTGLFLPFLGQDRNYPVVRSGKVALLTDEKIPWRNDSTKPTEMAELLLLETQSFGGNSGSPVFVTIPVPDQFGQSNLRLLGIMRGTFEQNRPILAIQNAAIAVAQQNLGIAAVVPAYLLWDILFGKALTELRKGNESKLMMPPKN